MRRIFGVALLLAGWNSAPAQQYVISTIAGGVPLPTPAAAAQSPIPSPEGIALDPTGNLYVASDQCIFKIANNQVMTRVVGTSRAGYSGDGGLATNAQLNNPLGIAVDKAGNVYIADSGNHRIRVLSADGTIVTVAGSGTAGFSGDGHPATSAQLNQPSGVALDSAGNLYIADTGNNRVRRVAKDGTISTIAGTAAAGYSGDGSLATTAKLNGPKGVVVDAAGSVYVADSGNGSVRQIGVSGIITTVAGVGIQGSGTVLSGVPANKYAFGEIDYISIDASGVVLFSDATNRKVWRLSGGMISRVAWFDQLMAEFGYSVKGVATDTAGNFYASMGDFTGLGNVSEAWWAATYATDGYIYMASPAGTVTQIAGGWSDSVLGDGGPASSARVARPGGVALDASGGLYVADTGYWRVRRVTQDGMMSSVPLNSYPVVDPMSVAVDSSGNLFVAFDDLFKFPASKGSAVQIYSGGCDAFTSVAVDATGNAYVAGAFSIGKVAPDGKWTSVAGSSSMGYNGDGIGANSAALNWPFGLALDAAGNLYFADSHNQRVRKITPGGLITTIAGNGVAGFKGDGGAATGAQLNLPKGVAVDGAGNVFISDTGNHRIRKVSTNGIITTIAGTGNAAYSGDGGLAIDADLNGPSGMQVDKAGNLYFADSNNNAVRVLRMMTPLSVAAATLPVAVPGVAYSQSVAATGGALPYVWSLISGSLPSGLTLSTGGVISGSPSSAGTYDFTLKVLDESGSTAAQAFRIRVVAPLTINAVSQSPAILGANYSQTLNASGGTPPYAWSVSAGTLPAGLTLSASGVLGGTPTALGTSSFVVQVQDSDLLTATLAASLQVINPAPTITTQASLSATVTGWSYSQTLAATGGNPPFAWTLSGGSLPDGLALSASGVISGTTTAAGTFNFAVAVTDSAGLTANQNFQLTVIAADSLQRAGVLPLSLMGAGFTTSISVANASATPIGVVLVLRGDDGKVVSSSAAWLAANAASTFTFGDAAAPPPAPSPWVDVLSSSAVTVSASLWNGSPAQIPVQTVFSSEADVNFDNTGGNSTIPILVNLSADPVTLTASMFDAGGSLLDQKEIAIPEYGRVSFDLALQSTATVGQQGIAKFVNPAGGSIAEATVQRMAVAPGSARRP
jgi:sugar lactone lactonase YvrE